MFPRSSRLFRCCFSLAACALSIGAAPLRVQAQPSPNGANTAPAPASAWQKFLDERFAPLVKTDPQAALDAGRAYLEANPTLKPRERLRFVLGAAQRLHGAPVPETQDERTTRALALLDAGLQDVRRRAEARDVDGLERLAAMTRVSILLDAKRLSEAQAALEPHLSDALGDDSVFSSALNNARRLYRAQSTPSETVRLLEETLEVRLVARRGFELNLFEQLVSELIEQKRPDEALSYAKLAFALCAFHDTELEPAAKMLKQAWTAQGKAADSAAFEAAQRDAKAPNPLQSVPLPYVSALLIAQQLPRAQAFAAKSRNNPQRLGELTTLLLLAKRNHEAMEVALQLSQASANVTAGAYKVARVYKASDSGVARASAYFAAAERGEVPDALADVPALPAEDAAQRLAALKNDAHERLIRRRRVEMAMFKVLIGELIAANRPDEALSYAKLAFVVCPFNTTDLEAASALLAQAWTANNAGEAVAAFIQAQNDASASNPLKNVPLPDVTALRTQLEAELARLPATSPSASIAQGRVTLLLLAGREREALEAAKTVWQNEATSAQGVAQVAQVLKASDASLVRANRFVALAQDKAANREALKQLLTP